ncbi:MAG: histidine kinase [Bacteroidia bacterium]|nr:histidine kinase [Bacteroidia bacterium]
MKGIIKLFSVLFLLLISNWQYAQSPLRFKQLADKDGLSSNQVTCFAQNKNGLMWIGTANGRNSYDGFRFRTFYHSAWDSLSIADSYVQCILSDHENRIWAGGRGKISLLMNGGVNFTIFIIPNSLKVYSLYEDAQNRIWAGCDNGLYLYNSQAKNFEKVLDKPVYDIDFKNPFLALTSRNAIYSFDPVKNNILGNYTDQFTGLGGMIYQPSTVTATTNELYITNALTGFFAANTRKEHYLRIDPFGSQVFKPVCHLNDSMGNIWIGCAKGLFVYHPSDSSLNKINEFTQSEDALTGDKHITCLFFDQSGLLWAGTRDRGIFIAGTIKNLFLPYQLPDFKETRVTSVEPYAYGVLVGTENKGLFSWVYPSNTVTALNKLGAQKINCISSTPDPDLYWIGTEKGLFAWVPSTNVFTLHKLYTDTLDQEITSIAVSEGQNIWTGTNFGLIRYVPSRLDIFMYTHKTNQSNSISEGKVKTLLLDSRNQLWVGTQTGLDLFNPNGSYFTHYSPALNIIHPDISQITEIKKGAASLLKIAVANAGFIELNPETRKVTTLIPDLFCESSIMHPSGETWVGTVGGVVQLRANGNYRLFNASDGLLATEHQTSSVCLLNDNNMLFGTSSGLYVLNSSYKHSSPPSFNFLLSSVLLDGKPGAFTNNTLELKPETKYLTIQFGTNDFSDPSSHNIQYRIEGLDTEWKKCFDGQVHLSNLSEGTYLLKVAEMADSKIINEQTLLTIQVVPPFWKSFAFRILILVLVAGLLWLLIARYIKRIKTSEAEKHELAKRAMQLELNAYKSQIDSQYIANIILAIQDCIDNNNLTAARNYLSKFSSLMSCLIEFADLEFISVDQLWKLLEYYLSIEKMRLGGQLEYRIDIAPDLDAFKVMVPNMLVQPYVENAVNLGLKQKIKERKISIRFELWSKKHVLCTIEDNGIGRKAAAKMRSSKIDFHRTAPTKVAEERIDLLEKTRGLETRLEIIDLVSDNGESGGTKVVLHLPQQN